MSQEKGSTYIRTHTHSPLLLILGCRENCCEIYGFILNILPACFQFQWVFPAPALVIYRDCIPTFLPKQYKGYGSRKFLKEFTALL